MFVKWLKRLAFAPIGGVALVFGGLAYATYASQIIAGAMMTLSAGFFAASFISIGWAIANYQYNEKLAIHLSAIEKYEAGAAHATKVMSHVVAKTTRPTRQTQIEAETGQQSQGFPMRREELVIEGLTHDLAEEE